MTRRAGAHLATDLDGLTGECRREALEHLAGCPACRRRVTAADPALVFALLGAAAVPTEVLERLTLAVESGLPPRPAARGWWPAAAALAASLLLTAMFGTYVSRLGSPEPATRAGLAAIELPAPPRTVELISSPGRAEVVDLAVGETRVVMIFDRDLDI